jgi:hypothetical protein
MPRRRVEVQGRSYVFSPDDQPPLGGRLWALVRAQLIDELTGQPPVSRITLEADLPGASTHVANDGLVGVLGIPHHVFPPLALRDYRVQLTVQANGYVSRRPAVVISIDQRAIGDPPPAKHATVITLNDVARLSTGEVLLVGPPGPTLTTVQIRALGPGPNQVTFAPALPREYHIGDPVVAVVPSDFTPTDLGHVALHRQPTVIYGRAVQANAGASTPLAGATIAVTGIWRTPPPANLAVPADPPNVVFLQPPLYTDRGAGSGRLQGRNLPAVPDPPAEEKRLLADVAAGANILRVSNRIGLNPIDILLIDADDSELTEFIAISAVAGASTAAQPATITLDHPLAHAHRRNALVQRVNPQPPGVERQLAQDAILGDTTVFLDSLAGLAAGSEVEVTGGPHPTEYHRLRLFATTSDAEGYYRLPPLSRVAQLEIRAEHGVLTPVQREFRPDYTLRENRLEVMFR